jgi:hypothetical protein
VGVRLGAQAAAAVPAAGGRGRARAEVTLGVIHGGVPGGLRVGRAGPVIGAHVGLPRRPRRRLVLGASYARIFDVGARCCGPNPGYRYSDEAVVLALGPEWHVAGTAAGGVSLALDLAYNPTLRHTIRRGSQADFTPEPTRWHYWLGTASAGVTWRRGVSPRLAVVVGARTYVHVPHPLPLSRFALTLGLGGQ